MLPSANRGSSRLRLIGQWVLAAMNIVCAWVLQSEWLRSVLFHASTCHSSYSKNDQRLSTPKCNKLSCVTVFLFHVFHQIPADACCMHGTLPIAGAMPRGKMSTHHGGVHTQRNVACTWHIAVCWTSCGVNSLLSLRPCVEARSCICLRAIISPIQTQ